MAMLQSTRLFPSTPPTSAISTPLSILDATVARFSPTGAIWIFDKSSDTLDESVLLGRLQASLVTTLNSFPQWAGQLQWAPFRPGGDHTERYHRPMIVYGTSSDPGIEWTVVKHSLSASSLAPTATERATRSKVWIGDDFPQSILLSSSPLALHNLRDHEGLSTMLVQVNLFAEGGYAIGMKLAHPLADAHALMVFVHQWAAASRDLYGHPSPSPFDPPIFDPALLDRSAAGDIDAAQADTTLSAISRSLPMHRYDWWQTADLGYPSILIPVTELSKPPAEYLKQTVLSPSTSAPWHTWDSGRSVAYALLHFSSEKIEKLKALAHDDPQGGSDISRLDALLAYIWSAVNRARGLMQSPDPVYLNVTLGVRTRVSPPLPSSFIGSPILLTYIESTGDTASASSVGKLGLQIRETLSRYTPENIGAILHDAAHEVAPQRLWQAFLGSQHTLVTSWQRLDLYGVDFEGNGQMPRYVHAVMPKVDGCVQVMDAGVDGVDLAVYLDSEAMKNLIDELDLEYVVDDGTCSDVITSVRVWEKQHQPLNGTAITVRTLGYSENN